jgi:hypothetical protein
MCTYVQDRRRKSLLWLDYIVVVVRNVFKIFWVESGLSFIS